MKTQTIMDALETPWQKGERNILGFDRAPADTRVVVAMSGGVDSSVTAALLKELGFDVVGITLQLYDHGIAVMKKGACCAGQDIHDARRVAETIGIPQYVKNSISNTSRGIKIKLRIIVYLITNINHIPQY